MYLRTNAYFGRSKEKRGVIQTNYEMGREVQSPVPIFRDHPNTNLKGQLTFISNLCKKSKPKNYKGWEM